MITSTIWVTGMGIILSFYQYLFLREMLGTKFRYTFLWLYLGTWIYGNINVRFEIVGTVWGNMIYLCICSFALNSLLFHGSVIKKGFFTLWMYGIREVAGSIFFPLFQAIAILNGQEDCLDIIMILVDLASCLIPIFMMELLKRKLYLLKSDFEDRDGIYLMCIVVFICITTGMTAMMFPRVAVWDREYVYLIAIPCSMTAIGGEMLNVYCILMLERRLVERLANQQYQMLEQQIEISKGQYEQFIKIRHDMKNHSLCLARLMADENFEEARHYLEQWNTGIEEGEAAVQTGSIFADALLNPKYHQAKKFGIDISIQMSVPGEDRIAPVDLCCLLANSLDNAMEACQRGIAAGYPAGWIRMSSQSHPGYWVYEISNSTYLSVRQHGGRFLSSKQIPMSGIGLQNIRTIVERYEGVLDLQSGTNFTLNVMIPLGTDSLK